MSYPPVSTNKELQQQDVDDAGGHIHYFDQSKRPVQVLSSFSHMRTGHMEEGRLAYDEGIVINRRCGRDDINNICRNACDEEVCNIFFLFISSRISSSFLVSS